LRQLQDTEGGTYKVLAPKYGSSWKKRSINQDQAQVILSIIRSPYQPKKKSEIIRISKAIMDQKGVQDGLSNSTYRRWIDDWISHNYDQWIWWREGDKGLNDKCSYWIERDYDRIDVGDVMVADGHVLNFEILNPWTGKPKRMILILWYDMKSNYPLGWEIMPTENTQAISSALRRAIIRLGKIPKVAYLDNGKAFASRFFRGTDFDEDGFGGVFDTLDIKPIYAWPYHGQSKTIERFFETFAELERMSPSYTGTSIAEKPPRLNRGEKLHRQIHEKITGGLVPTLLQAHRAIAAWFDEYARRCQRGHLNGRTPWEMFSSGQGDGVDIHRLRYLMMSAEVRTIRRRGIKFLGQWYYDPEMYGRKHEVTIKYDLQDPTSILVYDGEEFVCEAVIPPKTHPAVSALGNDDDKKLLAEQIGLKRGLTKQTVSSAREFVELSVVPEVREQISNAGFETGSQKSEVRSQKKVVPLLLSEAEKEEIQKDFERLEADQDRVDIWEQLPKLEDADRYEKLLEMESQSMLIVRDEQAFMRYFEQTEQYMQHEEYYDTRRTSLALMYQSENT
jgi:putative transposase